jgi:hypothetical protein
MDALDYINEGAGEEDDGNKDPITESGNLKNEEEENLNSNSDGPLNFEQIDMRICGDLCK